MVKGVLRFKRLFAFKSSSYDSTSTMSNVACKTSANAESKRGPIRNTIVPRSFKCLESLPQTSSVDFVIDEVVNLMAQNCCTRACISRNQRAVGLSPFYQRLLLLQVYHTRVSKSCSLLVASPPLSSPTPSDAIDSFLRQNLLW